MRAEPVSANHGAEGDGDLLIKDSGHVRMLTINRPARANALSSSLRRLLIDAFLDAGDDPTVRVIVLTARGDRVFCAGADLKEIAEADARGERFRPPTAQVERTVYEVVYGTYKPTIAALNGHAMGGGFELALACDIRLAVPAATLAFPEAKVGMGAPFGSVALTRHLPLGVALAMLFTGDAMSAEDALRWGLLNRVVPAAELHGEALALADRIAANAPLSVQRMKETALKTLDMPVAAGLRLDVGPNPYRSWDRAEGARAFVEKRPPRFEGR
jgi:enoyl-CoA hydratase